MTYVFRVKIIALLIAGLVVSCPIVGMEKKDNEQMIGNKRKRNGEGDNRDKKSRKVEIEKKKKVAKKKALSDSSKLLEILPYELWWEIFENMSFQDLIKNAAHASTEMRNMVLKYLANNSTAREETVVIDNIGALNSLLKFLNNTKFSKKLSITVECKNRSSLVSLKDRTRYYSYTYKLIKKARKHFPKIEFKLPKDPFEKYKTQGRKYRCPKCRQSVRGCENFNQHYNNCKGMKGYCCPDCDYSSSLAINFRRHITNHHYGNGGNMNQYYIG